MKSKWFKLCGSGPVVREEVITQACGDTLKFIKRSHMWYAFTNSWVDSAGGGSAWAIKQINQMFLTSLSC